jgi:ABC-type nitrate/sulfonate/bicarbonate transport system substrate-binding protein
MKEFISWQVVRRDGLRKSLATLAALVSFHVMPAMAEQAIKMNVGYQTSWAAIGNIFETLRHTNILELYNIEPSWKTFAFGGPTGEAFVAGEIDDIIAAEAPIVRAAARKDGTKIVARVNDYRFGILTLPSFTGTIADLKGKKIGAAFGAASFARVLDKLKSLGFNEPMQDFQLTNLDAGEMVNALQSKAIDAIVIWDPSLEKLITSGTAKAVWISEVGDQQGQGWIGFSGDFIKKNGDESVVRFLKAFITATWWASNNSANARKWFAETSRVTPDLLAAADSADRNLKKALPTIADVNFQLSDADVVEVQGIMDTMVKLKLVQNSPIVSKLVDPKYLALAQKEIAEGKVPDLSKIQIMLP